MKALIADGKRLKADTPESYCRCVCTHAFRFKHVPNRPTNAPFTPNYGSRLYRICNHDLSGSELDRLLPALGDALVLGITPKEALRGVVDHLEFVLDRMGDSRAAGAGAAAAGVGMEVGSGWGYDFGVLSDGSGLNPPDHPTPNRPTDPTPPRPPPRPAAATNAPRRRTPTRRP